MTKDMVGLAVENCINEIARCQQNIAAMYEINYRMSDRHVMPDEFNNASLVYWNELHKQLSDAWDKLSYFAPISKRAIDLLRERTKSWYEEEGHEIMSFLGYSGSYYTEDREEFRRQVLAMFGVK